MQVLGGAINDKTPDFVSYPGRGETFALDIVTSWTDEDGKISSCHTHPSRTLLTTLYRLQTRQLE
jgi:hypothetical protein